MMSDYAYQQAPARRRSPAGRGDFYGSSYDDIYPEYMQPYEYNNEWATNHRLPFDDREGIRDKATDHDVHSKFSLPTTTISATSGDWLAWMLKNSVKLNCSE